MKNALSFFFFFYTVSLSAQQYADCDSAHHVCQKSTYVFQHCSGEGRKPYEADFIPCFITGEALGDAERNSTWIKFQIKTAGKLMFEIDPQFATDDFDFVVFKLDKTGDCYKPGELVRCMAAGGKGPRSPCLGKTGLRNKEKDISEEAGCNNDQNNFLKPLDAQPDEWYALLISNMTSSSGFNITFSGDAKLMCEE